MEDSSEEREEPGIRHGSEETGHESIPSKQDASHFPTEKVDENRSE